MVPRPKIRRNRYRISRIERHIELIHENFSEPPTKFATLILKGHREKGFGLSRREFWTVLGTYLRKDTGLAQTARGLEREEGGW